MKNPDDIEDIGAIEASPMTGLLVIAFAAVCLIALGFGLGLAAAGVTC
jgi:hypothetical protein